MERIRPDGVTNHVSRNDVEDPVALSNKDFIASTTVIAAYPGWGACCGVIGTTPQTPTAWKPGDAAEN